MREVIFRGKRLDNEEWVYGGIRIVQGRYYIIPEDSNPFGFEVDPDTVGEYTGWTDKYDKKIFEGDIIESYSLSGDFARHRIGFDENMGCYIAILLIGQHAGYFFQLKQDWISEFDKVVAGNIHDNPELLEGGEK